MSVLIHLLWNLEAEAVGLVSPLSLGFRSLTTYPGTDRWSRMSVESQTFSLGGIVASFLDTVPQYLHSRDAVPSMVCTFTILQASAHADPVRKLETHLAPPHHLLQISV